MSNEREETGDKPGKPPDAGSSGSEPQTSAKLGRGWKIFWNRVIRFEHVIVLVLTIFAFGAAFDSMIGLREQTQKIENLQQITYIPTFVDVMTAITDAMKRYDSSVVLPKCFIITDLIGYGHFSFPEMYWNYERFLTRQRNLQLAALSPIGVKAVLRGQFAFKDGLTRKAAANLRKKINHYITTYSDRAEAEETFAPLMNGDLGFALMKQRATDSIFASQHGSDEFVNDQEVLINGIAAVESLLFVNFDKQNKGRGVQFDGPSSIHIWWFNEKEAYFALTDETGAEVNGFKSTNANLNQGLMEIAKKIILDSKNRNGAIPERDSLLSDISAGHREVEPSESRK